MSNFYSHKINTKYIEVQIFPDGRLNVKNASRYLGLSEKTLAMMRTNGTGPKFIKKGRIFYYEDDLKLWLNKSGRATSTAQILQSKRSYE
ncbi:MAG: helix-turn-helix domain-containing protein [Gammaproteobacteria bacterium]|jgi:hypothetical protein